LGEAVLTAVILFFFGLAGGATFLALCLVNGLTFWGVIVPLLDHSVGIELVVAEATVVTVEAWAIKGLSLIPAFQRDTFAGLSWRRVFLVAVAGNLFSIALGIILRTGGCRTVDGILQTASLSVAGPQDGILQTASLSVAGPQESEYPPRLIDGTAPLATGCTWETYPCTAVSFSGERCGVVRFPPTHTLISGSPIPVSF
jgi:hypothetical protein